MKICLESAGPVDKRCYAPFSNNEHGRLPHLLPQGILWQFTETQRLIFGMDGSGAFVARPNRNVWVCNARLGLMEVRIAGSPVR